TVFEDKKAEINQQIEEVKTNRNAIQEQLQTLQGKLSDLTLEQTQVTSEIRFEESTIERLEEDANRISKEIQLLQEI
ncbi:hypothetical protein ACXWOI_10320, partial [Streptococcus pyogenes]